MRLNKTVNIKAKLYVRSGDELRELDDSIDSNDDDSDDDIASELFTEERVENRRLRLVNIIVDDDDERLRLRFDFI
ncbi:hypothetical protein DERP_009863 [Dermatophagoides pteronyssinus]|uniref:Uncharacterized protein n=1 Tax=Dermatophagoides pteronyssinus TaxID=6956 RepID=A0ABQ8IRC8_DERPT|nr:hypothetical protein DERP_009863 [Dermatophagoides pteronyssinus]